MPVKGTLTPNPYARRTSTEGPTAGALIVPRTEESITTANMPPTIITPEHFGA
jgi:hypothetical protein